MRVGVWLAVAAGLAGGPGALAAAAAAAAAGGAEEACDAEPMAGPASSLMQLAEKSMQGFSVSKVDKATVGLSADADSTVSRAEKMVVSLAEKVALQNYTMTPVEREAVDTIKSMIEKMINASFTQHAEDQWEVDEAREGIANCSNDLKSGRVENLMKTVDSHRDGHRDCREIEVTKRTDQSHHCNIYETARKTEPLKSPPGCMFTDLTEAYIKTDDPDMKENMESCLDQMNDWFPPLYAFYDACRDRGTVVTEQQTTCNQAQGTFEQSFCTYASQLTTLCDGQEACRNAAIEHFNKTVTHVHETEIVRKADYRAAKHILCFFGVFDAPDADKNTVLQECKGKTYDTSNLTIIVPGIPDAMPCTPETHQPCDPTWTQAEYGSQTWHSTAPTTDCTPCV